MNFIFVVNNDFPIYLYMESRAELGARFLIAKFNSWDEALAVLVPQQFSRDPETGVLPTWRVRGNNPANLATGQYDASEVEREIETNASDSSSGITTRHDSGATSTSAPGWKARLLLLRNWLRRL